MNFEIGLARRAKISRQAILAALNVVAYKVKIVNLCGCLHGGGNAI